MAMVQSLISFSLLLVEDEETARDLIARMLVRKFPNCTIHKAVNGIVKFNAAVRPSQPKNLSPATLGHGQGKTCLGLVNNGNPICPQERVEARVSAGGMASARKRELRFIATDSGICISNDKKGRFSQPFSLVDSSHTRRHSERHRL